MLACLFVVVVVVILFSNRTNIMTYIHVIQYVATRLNKNILI